MSQLNSQLNRAAATGSRRVRPSNQADVGSAYLQDMRHPQLLDCTSALFAALAAEEETGADTAAGTSCVSFSAVAIAASIGAVAHIWHQADSLSDPFRPSLSMRCPNPDWSVRS
jgi:hypothetical protein